MAKPRIDLLGSGGDARAGWIDDAMCRDADPEMFFPEGQGHNDYADARKLCEQCPVKRDCLEDALTLPSWVPGFWAGKTPRELQRIKKQRRRLGNSCPDNDS